MKRKEVIIFDLDGLLVDTEKLFYRSFKIVAKKRGFSLPAFSDYIDKVVSSGLPISELFGLQKLSATEFENEVFERYGTLLKEKLELKRGAIACLEKLTDYHLVLVTGSRREFTDYILSKTNMSRFFKSVYTRDDNFPPKPNSKIFEHILSSFNVNKWECLLIEDSKRGITAALSAGIPSIIVPNEYSGDAEFGPRVERLRKLEDITPDKVDSVFDKVRPKVDHTLVNLYRDSISRLEATYSIYKDIYGLDEFKHIDEKVSPNAFAYARKRSYFIILAMLTTEGRVYFQRSFDNGHLSMLLPGAGVHMSEQDTILVTINRIARRILKNARLADVAPVTYLINRFVCIDGRSIEHIGLGIRALLLNEESELSQYMKDIAVKGAFVHSYEQDDIPQPPSRHTYSKVMEWVSHKDYSTYLNEIKTQSEVIWRYKFHQSFINPILKVLSHCFGKYSIRYVKNHVLTLLRGVNSFVDVACGDDKNIFSVLEKVPLVVANDISTDQLASMEKEYSRIQGKLPKSNAILFTNHDCLDLPFRENAFDVALCRNLLHHMLTAKDLTALLTNLRKVAKKIIVVEVQDPASEGFWGKLRHSYYMHFLKDVGQHFYDRHDFETVITQHFSNDKAEFEYHPTFRGVYMTAVINKKQNNI